MKNNKYLRITIFVFLLTSCVPFHEDVEYCYWIHNNSEKEIYIMVSFIYPDTSIPNISTYKEILPKSKKGYCLTEPWNDAIKDLPADTFSLFVFDSEIINRVKSGTINWEEVQEKYLILKRKDISADVIRSEKKIEYP